MPDINESYLRRVNLNLLVIFLVLMREGSVTRAAEKLCVTQAAVSAALSRLRELLADPLFVRTPAGMEPTAHARKVAALLGGPIAAIQEVLSQGMSFDPEQDQRTFVLGLSDDLEVTLVPRLLKALQAKYPLIRLNTVQLSRANVADMLEDDATDLALSSPPREPEPSLHIEKCLCADYVCMYDPARIGASGDIDLDQYIALPHIIVTSQKKSRGVVDAALEEAGLHRKVLTSTSHYAGLIALLKSTAAVSTVPRHVAVSFGQLAGLAFCAVPIDLPEYTVSLIWHSRNDAMKDNAWLRDLIRLEVARLGGPA